MNLMLKRGIEVLVGAALLLVALFTVLPAVAQAQEEGAAPARVAVVVKPGDTLWSISEERLGPQATPQQIAAEVEQIYALNQDRIGSDPNLIISGQEFSLPKPTGSSSAASAASAGTAAKEQSEAAKAESGGTTVKGEPANQQANNLPTLPKMPAASSVAAVPAIGSLSLDAPPTTTTSAVASFLESVRSAVTSAVTAAVGTLVGTFAEVRAMVTDSQGRVLLGWGIIVLSSLLGVLMAWKLPMRRNIEDGEVWGISSGYPAGGYPAYAEKTLDSRRTTSSVPEPATVPRASVQRVPVPEPTTNGSKAAAQATTAVHNTTQAEATSHATKKDGASAVGLGGIAQKRRQLTTRRRSKGLSRRRKSAAEAQTAEARRLLRGAAVLRTRPLKPRNPRLNRARQIAGGGR